MPHRASSRVGVAVIGAGVISDEYLHNLTRFPDLEVIAVGDQLPERAGVRADAHGVPVHGTVATVLDHADVEIVVNLTTPAAHVDVSVAAVTAGKHVYSEKPLALDTRSGAALLSRADEAGVRVGVAPDTVLGGAFQYARRAIDAGLIGDPISAITMVQDPGPEHWHPDPAFLFESGGGPLWDLGPYYIAALLHLFGPVARVSGMGTTAFLTRTIGSGPRQGETFPVAVPTNVDALLEFRGGQVAHSTYSYESAILRAGWFEVNGTDAVVAIGDPNHFSGDIHLYPKKQWSLDERRQMRGKMIERSQWERIPTGAWTATRGLGVLDMARSIRAGTPHRASGELGLHAVEVMEGISLSLAEHRSVDLRGAAPRPQPVEVGWDPYLATLR